jgi:hypothetical protein
MADDSQKNPLIKNLQLYVQAMMDHFIETLGKSLPCSVASIDPSGTIVTVNIEVQDPIQQFPQVTCPVAYPGKYVRYPLQVGDQGLLISSDVYLGGVSGLGGGIATLAQQGNLSTCAFLGLGNSGLPATDDPKAQVLTGPNGVIMRDSGTSGPGVNGSMSRIQVDGKGNVTIFGATSYSWDIGGYGQRIIQTGPGAWTINNYVTGASVTTNDLPISPPHIPNP